MSKRRLSDGTLVDLTPEEEAERAAASAALQADADVVTARAARVADALVDVPANTNSFPALVAEVNKLKAIMRGDL